MRCTFEVGHASEGGTSWVEEIDPPPVASSTITHDGRSYVVQPFPLYARAHTTEEFTATFVLIEVEETS
jgi:hypothetical protein